MKKSKILFATLLAALSFDLPAQCQFATPTCNASSLAPNTDCVMYYTGGMSLFSACNTTAGNATCGKQTVVRRALRGMVNTTALTAMALSTTTTASYCQWECDCGAGPETLRIDRSDGLPVELLEFLVSSDEKGG